VNDLLLSVLELIIKWLQLAPQYYGLRIDEPHAYLSDRNSSIYCLGNELIEILISILGLNPRTSKFFEKYKNFTSVKTFIANFLNKGGMKALLAITKSEMPVEDIWKLSVNIPSIFSINTTSANDRYLPEYIDGLIEKFNNISYEALSTISENKEELKRFVDNMENITDLIYEDAQKNKVLQFFTQKLKVEVVSSPRYSMISNRDSTNNLYSNAMKLPTPHSLPSAQMQGVQSGQVQHVRQNSIQSSGNAIQVTSANPLQMSVGNPTQVTTASSMQVSSGNSTMFQLASDPVQIPSIPNSSAFALSQSVPITPKQRNILRHATQGMKLDIPDEESFKFEVSSNRESVAFKSSRFSVIDPRLSVQESCYNPVEPIIQGSSIDSIVSELKHLIEARHKECIDLISSTLNNEVSRKSDNDYKLDEIFKSHSSCDQQEFAILSSLEYWLQENKIEEALRLIIWRKKILKIAKMNGWAVAREIAKRTLSTLCVTSMDLIEGNMRVVLNNANSLEKATED
jgi:hypothetical protein